MKTIFLSYPEQATRAFSRIFFPNVDLVKGLWCLVPLSRIFQLQYIVAVIVLVEEPGENHRPAASDWQTLKLNVISSTLRLSGIRTHNVSGDTVCTDCIDSYKSNYHTLTIRTVLSIYWYTSVFFLTYFIIKIYRLCP